MDNWQAGDLALCVNTSRRVVANRLCTGGHKLTKGRIYTVLGWAPCSSMGTPAPVLFLQEIPGSAGAFRFRKINPLTPEEHEDTMHELLTGRPVKEPVSMALAHCPECSLFLRSHESCPHIGCT